MSYCEANTIFCDIGGLRVKFLIDSGARINTVGESVWAELERLRERGQATITDVVHKPLKVVRAYATRKPLEVVASFKTHIMVLDCEKPPSSDEFYVIKNAEQSLLSSDTAKKLKLLKVGVDVNAINLKEDQRETDPSATEFPKIPNFQLKFDINENEPPVKVMDYKVPLALEEAVHKRICEMLAKGIIEPSPKPARWMSRLGVVAKGKNDFRPVVDMRRVNRAIKRKPYHLPTIEEITPQLVGSERFTHLDLKSAYHHVELHPESREYTTFMSRDGPMQFTRLAFGVNCAPEVFQKLMVEILKGCEGAIVFIDDILIFAKDSEELSKRQENVLRKLRQYNLSLNTEKCEFNRTEVEFLGHIINKDGIRPKKFEIESIGNSPLRSHRIYRNEKHIARQSLVVGNRQRLRKFRRELLGLRNG